MHIAIRGVLGNINEKFDIMISDIQNSSNNAKTFDYLTRKLKELLLFSLGDKDVLEYDASVVIF